MTERRNEHHHHHHSSDSSVHSSSSRRSKSSKSKHDSHSHSYDNDNDDEREYYFHLQQQNGHDDDGRCLLHPDVQIAKKKLMSHKWKTIRECPACRRDDDKSVRSGRRGRASSKDRRAPQYDADGYCCLHPHVRLAKKKTIGNGWKALLPSCPDCQREGVGDGGKQGRSRRRSRSNNSSRHRQRSLSKSSKRSTSSALHSERDEDDDDTRSVVSSSSIFSKFSSKSSKKQHQLSDEPRKVKNIKIRDQNRVPGRYTGYVDGNGRPCGRGRMRYENGMEWKGVWREGEQVCGELVGYKSKF